MNIEHNKQLQQFNSFRTKAVARLFCEPQTIDELSELLKSFRMRRSWYWEREIISFFTKDYDGLVIKPGMKEINIVSEGDEYAEIEAGAGIDWDSFVEECVGRGYSGMKTFHLCGSVGAAPMKHWCLWC